MHKLTIRLSNDTSPLEEVIIPNGAIEKVILVEDILNINDILDKVEDIILKIDGHNKARIRIQAFDEKGYPFLDGGADNGSFHGVAMHNI